MRVLTLTGHRDLLGRERIIDTLLRKTFGLYGKRYGEFRVATGGAGGADARGAYAAIRMDVWHTIMLPHMDYPSRYNIDLTPQIGPKTVVGAISEKENFHYKMNFDRNLAMLEQADDLVVVSHMPIPMLLDQEKGGTVHCVKAAYRMDKFESCVHIDTANKRIIKYKF